MSDYITDDHSDDGVDRRGFLRCMAWAGTGMLWTISGGVLSSTGLGRGGMLGAAAAKGDLFFAQISDSHIGFNKAANQDVTATLREAVDRINALPRQPAFLLHTGDISQLSKPGEFDTAQQVIATARTRTGRTFYVPGEHDVLGDNGAAYLGRYGKGATGGGWYSFDYQGVHFVTLVNVLDLKPGGLGNLGREQLEWLERDVKRLPSSTPIVVFAHVPLWSVYPQWGWGTDDGAQALAYLRRFGSVTVLNGHIHQVVQKIEGNMRFHTAMSTAFPQPAPGTADAPGPLTVPAEQLRNFLGLTSVTVVPSQHSLALVDSTLSGVAGAHAVHAREGERGAAASVVPGAVGIDNFSFTPKVATLAVGGRVTWVNHDDVPHQIISSDKRFPPSPVLDTGQRYEHAFDRAGRYPYFCSIHPTMTGAVEVH
ncbi:MAG TPA: metallophosphoesterase [Gemmatimonadaceae bacterium]|nr:metallophosphoesterase [Gemmatimonadaceae bacterium]